MKEDYISERQDFSKIFNGNGDTGKTFNSIFQMPEQAKKRKFPGASTKRGFGPVFDPTNPAFKTMNSDLSGGDEGAAMGGGDAGGGMGESIDDKFIGLLEALRTESNSEQIDLIRQGFDVMNEAGVADMIARKRQGSDARQNAANAIPSDQDNARNEKKANQLRGLQVGAMTKITKAAMVVPDEIEKWMNTSLKDAIKQGKENTDAKFGTNTAKRSIMDRIKSAGKSFTEAEDES